MPAHPLIASAAGSNALLADGARPALTVNDVLEELGGMHGPSAVESATRSTVPRPAGLAGRVVGALSAYPQTADQLAAAVTAPAAAVLAALTELELLGMARSDPNARYTLPVAPPGT